MPYEWRKGDNSVARKQRRLFGIEWNKIVRYGCLVIACISYVPDFISIHDDVFDLLARVREATPIESKQ
jgi:hypothetical protein